ncbi:uncharacterized protein RJT21DRAFT_116248 [Scheffersomyces amazonensis]|uniref:uncharacterized protein n=1 Tax=Scheffersomyces amazonensis TaxID=1078765 RepID=UPI00315CF688
MIPIEVRFVVCFALAVISFKALYSYILVPFKINQLGGSLSSTSISVWAALIVRIWYHRTNRISNTRLNTAFDYILPSFLIQSQFIDALHGWYYEYADSTILVKILTTIPCIFGLISAIVVLLNRKLLFTSYYKIEASAKIH